MSRHYAVTITCDEDGCTTTAKQTFETYPGGDREQGQLTAEGFHIVIEEHSGEEFDFCGEHWEKLGFDADSEVEYT